MSAPSGRGEWSSQLGFVLAAAGSAIGLGNIWRFPYVAGESGGGAFVLVCLICVAFIALPVMLLEISLGRATQKKQQRGVGSCHARLGKQLPRRSSLRVRERHVETHASGTNIDGELAEILQAVGQVHETMHQEGSIRLVSYLKLETRMDKVPTLAGKRL